MGFFKTQSTRKSLKQFNKGVLAEFGKEEGCKVCPLSKNCAPEKRLKPLGPTDPLIYILGELPTSEDAKKGKPFLGKKGAAFKSILSNVLGGFDNLVTDVRFGNVLTCPTPAGRNPTQIEMSCCSTKWEDDIEETKPLVICGLGDLTIKMVLKTPYRTQDVRGRIYPVKIKSHECFFIPTYSLPILSKLGSSFAYPNEHDKIFQDDLAKALTCFEKKPSIISSGYLDDIYYVDGSDPKHYNIIQNRLEDLSKEDYLSVDIETTGIKPYKDKAKLLTFSVGTFEKTLAFPLEHPRAWKGKYTKIKSIVDSFLRNSPNKICHNLSFELEWFANVFSDDTIYETEWEDSMAQAYCLDERSGDKKAESPLSLNSLCKELLGFNLKALNKLDIKNLINENLSEVLEYNAMDVKYTHKIYELQKDKIQNNLFNFYRHLVETSRTLAITQKRGVKVNVELVDKISSDLSRDIKVLESECLKQPCIIEFVRRFKRPFKITSNGIDLVLLFRDILKLKKIRETIKGGFSTDNEVLVSYEKQGVKVAGFINKHRVLSKLKTTYVDGIKVLLTGDDTLRTTYNILFTSTTRLSSENPNLQNFPKRENKYVRNIIIP